MEVRRRPLLLVLVVGLAVAGCSVGEYGAEQQSMSPDAAQVTGGANEASFNATVKPLVATCVSCHGAQPPTLTSYAMLQPKYKMRPGNTNILVTKGDHQGITYFNATDKAAIQGWIDGLQ
jgi:cytochrome c553